MTPRQRTLVRGSWAKLRRELDATSALFYERLFALNPNARRLFGSKDMRLQGTLFMQMLSLFVRGLDDDDPDVVEALKDCGRRHVAYGVSYTDYEGVGQALLATVEQMHGDSFTPELRDAWSDAYRSLAATMLASSSIL